MYFGANQVGSIQCVHAILYATYMHYSHAVNTHHIYSSITKDASIASSSEFKE